MFHAWVTIYLAYQRRQGLIWKDFRDATQSLEVYLISYKLKFTYILTVKSLKTLKLGKLSICM